MNLRPGPTLLTISFSAVVLAVFLASSGSKPDQPVAAQSKASPTAAVAQTQPAIAADKIAPAEAFHDVTGSHWNSDMPAECAAFRNWAKRYLAASAADRPALLAEGMALAKDRDRRAHV